MSKSVGQVAYEAYAGSFRPLNGDTLPPWEGLSPEEQEHWRKSAHAVARDSLYGGESNRKTQDHGFELPEQWEPYFGSEKPTLETAIEQAIESASLAWNPKPSGVFDSHTAAWIADGLAAAIREGNLR